MIRYLEREIDTENAITSDQWGGFYMLLQILTITHHITTMLFGIFLSAFFLGVKQNKKNILFLLSTSAVYGILYLFCVVFCEPGLATVLYPLLIHLPLFLLLVFYYHFRWLPALLSILTAYLCCQFSNWIGILAFSIVKFDWVYYLVRIIVTVSVFFILSRQLCQTTALLFAKPNRQLYILGAVPFLYYVFDYLTTKLTDLLYSGSDVVVEFLSFALCISYMIFLLIYFHEYELKNQAELNSRLADMQLYSLRSEIEQVRNSEQRIKILRHDMRHHLAAIQTFISQNETERALSYIHEINEHYDDTVIHTFCKNDLVNSVLSIYQSQCTEKQITFDVQVRISPTHAFSEMTFCAILSNLLENAMHAVLDLPKKDRLIHLRISEKTDHLLILQKNPTLHVPVFVNDIPVATKKDHGVGVQSVIYYVEKEHGQYQFYMENGNFVVRIIL